MRVLRSKKKKSAAAIVGLTVVAAFAAAVALGSPPFGFVGDPPLVTANLDETVHWNSDRVKFQTKGPTDVRIQKVTISPGGHSGWHHHPGIVVVSVASGVVTYTQSDCGAKTYGPGQPNGSVFVEGGDEPARASSVAGATLYATYVAPDANPPVFRIEDNPPACAS